jgi:glycosyltransferase involved in cell wall biosynthesis
MEANVGIQVLISSHNCEEYLEDCFNSIEIAFNGYKWMMVFCDDASTDNTESVVNTYKTTTSADNIVYQKFEKASIVGKAKNRACLLSRAYKDDYPVICFMDSDDTMGAQRISGLLPELSEDYPIVFGDFVEQQKNENGEWVKMEESEADDTTFDGYITTSTRTTHLTFGPWATLILGSLIPEDGVFFREDISNYDDILTWWTLHYRDGVAIKDVPGFITHYQKFGRPGSLIDSQDMGPVMEQLYFKKMAIHTIPGYEEA